MNIDGTGWIATKRTTGGYLKWNPQRQVVGSKIYYVWSEGDGTYLQIWTGEMNIDGTGWMATKRTTDPSYKYNPQLQVVGSKIYYVWVMYPPSIVAGEIWTAEMNIDGTGWIATERTGTVVEGTEPQFQVVGSKIYYVWDEETHPIPFQIWTGEMNIDGTGWMATRRTTSPYDKFFPQLQVVGSKIYYVWQEPEVMEIWTAEMNIDGTGWIATRRIAGAESFLPQLQVVGSKIYYVWIEFASHQIWTAEINIDGTGWIATRRTTSLGYKHNPQLQVVGNKIYYVWTEGDGTGYSQIWTGEMSLETPTIGIKDEDILKKIVEVLTKLIQLHNQLIEILSR
jgi:hypothetical protein